MSKLDSTKWGWLVLFTSIGTLLCCALPILLVSLGLGAVMASLASNLPFLIVLSKYKIWTFIVSGVILLLAGWALYRKGQSCPIDPELARRCAVAKKWNKRLFWASIVVWTIGFSTSYLLLPFL